MRHYNLNDLYYLLAAVLVLLFAAASCTSAPVASLPEVQMRHCAKACKRTQLEVFETDDLTCRCRR
jgi:hypothetical protein